LIKAHSLPAGWSPARRARPSSKTRYVMRRLQKLSDQQVLGIAKRVAADFPDD
jgi:hypothetical protein